MRGPQCLKGAILWLTLSLLFCKHSSYWVTNYLPQTNRCLIWFQVFNCTVEIIHYTSLTALFGSSQLCLQVKSLHHSFQMDFCVSLLQIQRVHYSFRHLRMYCIVEDSTFSFSGIQFIIIKSYKIDWCHLWCSVKKNETYLFPLQSVVLILWAFGISKGARKGMRAGLGKPLTLPLALWKISALSPRLPEVCILSSVLFISLMWAS